MALDKIWKKLQNRAGKPDAVFGEIQRLSQTQKELLDLCAAAEKRLVDTEERLIHVEERLIHVEERLEHVEERCRIMDEDKLEDMRSRLIHIEDKINVVLNQNTGDIYVSFE